jgi:hypothetical protein
MLRETLAQSRLWQERRREVRDRSMIGRLSMGRYVDEAEVTKYDVMM